MKEPRDEDGIALKHGDHFTFTFGIPPTSVLCRLTFINERWCYECIAPPDVKPKSGSLADLTRYYQIWKASRQRVAAAKKNWATK